MSLTEWLTRLAVLIALLVVAFWVAWLVERRRNPPSHCFDCRRGHHDHDIESGTCRRPDCRCDQ